MKSLVIFIVFFVSSYFAFGQYAINPYISTETKKFNTGVSVGTTFSNGSFGTYLAPSFNHQVSNKLNLNYGIVFQNNSANSMMYDYYTGYSYQSPTNSTSLYLNSEYKISNRLRFTSTVIVQNNRFGGNEYQAEMNNFNANFMQMGFEYKVTENIRIQAEIGLANGMNPYSALTNPYNYNPFNKGISPFYSPFMGY